MGNKKDGIKVEHKKDGATVYKKDGAEPDDATIQYKKQGESFLVDDLGKIKKEGSLDAISLATKYKELAKNGLSEGEKEALRNLDRTAKGASILGPDDFSAMVHDKSNNKVYHIPSDDGIDNFKAKDNNSHNKKKGITDFM